MPPRWDVDSCGKCGGNSWSLPITPNHISLDWYCSVASGPNNSYMKYYNTYEECDNDGGCTPCTASPDDYNGSWELPIECLI